MGSVGWAMDGRNWSSRLWPAAPDRHKKRAALEESPAGAGSEETEREPIDLAQLLCLPPPLRLAISPTHLPTTDVRVSHNSCRKCTLGGHSRREGIQTKSGKGEQEGQCRGEAGPASADATARAPQGRAAAVCHRHHPSWPPHFTWLQRRALCMKEGGAAALVSQQPQAADSRRPAGTSGNQRRASRHGRGSPASAPRGGA